MRSLISLCKVSVRSVPAVSADMMTLSVHVTEETSCQESSSLMLTIHWPSLPGSPVGRLYINRYVQYYVRLPSSRISQTIFHMTVKCICFYILCIYIT